MGAPNKTENAALAQTRKIYGVGPSRFPSVFLMKARFSQAGTRPSHACSRFDKNTFSDFNSASSSAFRKCSAAMRG